MRRLEAYPTVHALRYHAEIWPSVGRSRSRAPESPARRARSQVPVKQVTYQSGVLFCSSLLNTLTVESNLVYF